MVNLRPSKKRAKLSLNTVECEASRPVASVPKVSKTNQQRRTKTLHQHAPGPDSDLAHEDSHVPDSPEATEIGVCQDNSGNYQSFNPLIHAAKFGCSSIAAKLAKAQQRMTSVREDGVSKQSVSSNRTHNAETSNLPDIRKEEAKDPWVLRSDSEGGRDAGNQRSADDQMPAPDIIPDSDPSKRSEKPSKRFQKKRKSNLDQNPNVSMPEQRTATRLDTIDEQAKGSADTHYDEFSPDKAATNASRGTGLSQKSNKGGVAKRKSDKHSAKSSPISKRKSANSTKLLVDKHAEKEEHTEVESDKGSDSDFLPTKGCKERNKKRWFRLQQSSSCDTEDEPMPEELNDVCIPQPDNSNKKIPGDVPASRDSPEPDIPSCIDSISFSQICHATHNIYLLFHIDDWALLFIQWIFQKLSMGTWKAGQAVIDYSAQYSEQCTGLVQMWAPLGMQVAIQILGMKRADRRWLLRKNSLTSSRRGYGASCDCRLYWVETRPASVGCSK